MLNNSKNFKINVYIWNLIIFFVYFFIGGIMKLLQQLKFYMVIFILTALTGNLSLFSQEAIHGQKNNFHNYKEIEPANTSLKAITNLPPKSLTVNFKVLDSLANAYSYFTESQQPFIYYAPKNLLATIKRGYYDLEKTPGYTGTHTKDNLVILKSYDHGKTWSQPILVYNSKSPNVERDFNARYPSVYAFEYDGIIHFAYTAPATGGTGWRGFINGIHDSLGFFITLSKTFTIGGQSYNWGGTDSKIYATTVDNDPMALAIGAIMPPGGIPLEITSNLAYRMTTDFEKWVETIPPAWSADRFVIPSSQTRTDSLRSSSIVGLKPAGNKLYMGAYGNFKASETNTKNVPAFSVSTDYGVTWSEFDIMPWSIIQAYSTQLGVDHSAIGIGSSDFAVFDNGNVSFIMTLNEDTTRTLRLYEEAVHQVVEVYKEGSTWGIRKIADVSGYVLAYLGASSNNQMGGEEMISRTADGEYLVAKWVDFIDAIDQNGNIIKNYTTDILVAVRQASSNSWGNVINITESEIYDRITWIPNLLPNDLKDVPILKVETIPNPTDDAIAARNRQRTLETEPQYVVVGNFDATLSLGVEDSYDINPLTVYNIYPNPSNIDCNVDFYLPNNSDVKIELYTLLGQKVKVIADEYITSGIKSVRISTADIPSGVYSVMITVKGQTTLQKLNIIH
jgi:hypothetical protein